MNNIDYEQYRVNYCAKWKDINPLDATENVNFNLIHSGTQAITETVCGMKGSH